MTEIPTASDPAPARRVPGTCLPARDQALAAAAALGEVDVLIIGAGINGAATFRDLALQGVRVLIVDREDFGAGASMASSRLAHGGLRYLENGEFRLTAESTRERNRLLRNVPHMVRPLPIAIPFFSRSAGLLTSLRRMLGAKVSLKERGFVMSELGLFLYDWFGRLDRTMPRHRVLVGARAREHFPALNRQTVAVSIYYDAVVAAPERIALELIDDGLQASPTSVALNHCEVTGLDGAAVAFRDRLDQGGFVVRPKLVLNAAGSWIDRVNGRLASARPLMGGTKGSHLVLNHPRLFAALAGHGVIFDDGQGRVCFAYPLAETVLLGSTDIPVDDPDEAVCSEDEQAYLLEVIRRPFPDISVERRHVVYRFCGVRPLPRSDAATPGAVSRDHSLVLDEANCTRPFPVLSLVGGKWTTFRAFAEQVGTAVLKRLARPRTVDTARLPIGGAVGLPGPGGHEAHISDLASRFGLGLDRARALFGRYGSGAESVARFLAQDEDRMLPGLSTVSDREIRRFARCEMAVTVEDVIFRRTNLAMEGRLSSAVLARIAALLAEENEVPAAVSQQRLADVVARLVTLNTVPGLCPTASGPDVAQTGAPESCNPSRLDHTR